MNDFTNYPVRVRAIRAVLGLTIAIVTGGIGTVTNIASIATVSGWKFGMRPSASAFLVATQKKLVGLIMAFAIWGIGAAVNIARLDGGLDRRTNDALPLGRIAIA
jgi:hypothetical protein